MESLFELRRFSPSINVQTNEPMRQCSSGSPGGLLAVDSLSRRVIWYSECGGRVIRQYTCECEPIQAIFCTFSELGTGDTEDYPNHRASEHAVCILLTPVHLRLHLSSGTSHDIQLPRQVEKIFAFPSGLVLQCKVHEKDVSSLPSLYTLLHPYAPISPIALPFMDGLDESILVSSRDFFCSTNEKVVCMWETMMCTLRIEVDDASQITVHLTLRSLVPIPPVDANPPPIPRVRPSLENIFPAAIDASPSPSSSSRHNRASPGLTGTASASASPIMMDVVGSGSRFSTGPGPSKLFQPIGILSTSQPSSRRKSPLTLSHMMSHSPSQSPVHMTPVANAGQQSLPPPPPHQFLPLEPKHSPSEALAAIFGLDAAANNSGSAHISKDRDIYRPAGGTLQGGSGVVRSQSPENTKRSSPSWAHRGLNTSSSMGSGMLPTKDKDSMDLSYSRSTESPGPVGLSSPIQSEQQALFGGPQLNPGLNAADTEPLALILSSKSTRGTFFSSAPNFSTSVLDVTSLTMPMPPGASQDNQASEMQVIIIGGQNDLGGVLCHVLHPSSGRYRCLSIDVDPKPACFGHTHAMGSTRSTTGSTVKRATFRPIPSLNGEDIRSMAHMSVPMSSPVGQVGSGVNIPVSLIRTSSSGVWLHVGSERVAATHLTLTDDIGGDAVVLGSTGVELATVHCGRTLQLLARLHGQSSLMSMQSTLFKGSNNHAGAHEVLLSVLSALQPTNSLGRAECNSLAGLVVGVMLLAADLYTPSSSAYYLLSAALSLPFPSLPPQFLTSTAPSLAPGRRAILEMQLHKCHSALSECCSRLSVGSMIFDAVHITWEDLRLQVCSRSSAMIALQSIGASLAVVAAASAAYGGSTIHATAKKFVQHYWEQSGKDSNGTIRWPCPAVIPSSSSNAAGACFTQQKELFCAGRWLAESIAKISQLAGDFPPDLVPLTIASPPLPGNLDDAIANDLGLHPCPAIRLADRIFRNIYSLTTESGGQISAQSPESWARLISEAYIRASSSDAMQASIDLSAISLLPAALRGIVEVCLLRCRECPNPQWPDSILHKIGRDDIATMRNLSACKRMGSSQGGSVTAFKVTVASPTSDGLSEVEASSLLRFPRDDRVHEVCRMLNSTKNIYLRIDKAPETTDLDHRHKLQLRLLTLCRRSLAVSVGRGMLTMQSLEPLMAEALPIPAISLQGRIAPSNSLIQLDSSPHELSLWPEFHNGVAAGLRVGHSGTRSLAGNRKVTRNWIIFNRTASASSETGIISHAGVLLAMGLQGHLGVLTAADVCDYLTQGHEPTTIAVLIGLAASKRGTADSRISKTLCLHLPALLPPRHWDIEISPLVQTASLAGLGLLHAGSGHRLMAEFLLAELSRKPSSDRCDTREAMALSAAWALGVVLLGKGSSSTPFGASGHVGHPPLDSLSVPDSGANGLSGLNDLHIEDRLHLHIVGGRRPPDSHLFPSLTLHDSHSKSSRVLEGGDINTDVTAPGATIALALIYIRSNNTEIASRIALPNTVFALDSIRPDLLLFRALGRCLILWDHVQPTAEWLDSQIPSVLSSSLFNDGVDRAVRPGASSAVLNTKAALLAYLCTVAGYCFGIGMVYAGTGDMRANSALLSKLKLLQGFRDNKPSIPQAQAYLDKSLRPLIDMCVSVTANALGCVMAGTGNIDCLRTFRELRFRVDDVTYGTHLALNMAIGMLFLAGGNASVKRDPLSIACLVMAFAPNYPLRTTDNQYHLQPLRHLYVLAVEERALHTVDVESGAAVSVDIQVELKNPPEVVEMCAPCLLPDLQRVISVRVGDSKKRDDEGIRSASLKSHVSPFYPTTIDLSTDRPTDHSATGKGAASAASGPSVGTSMPACPVLVVKRRPVQQASTMLQPSAASEHIENVLRLLESDNLQRVETDVCRSIENCAPLVSLLLAAD